MLWSSGAKHGGVHPPCGPTSNLDEILAWAERHDAIPAEVRPYAIGFAAKTQPSVLHFLFGVHKNGTFELRPISWEVFLGRFKRYGLAMVYDDSPSFAILQVRPSV